MPRSAVRAWIRTADDREWIIYSTTSLESWKLWRIGISPRGAIDDKPELVASGNGRLGPCGSAQGMASLPTTSGVRRASIYQISISDRGQKLGPTLQLPLREAWMRTALRPSPRTEGGWHTKLRTPASPTPSC